MLLTWAGHDLAAIIVVVVLWQALDGGGGWAAWSIVVVVGRKKQRCGNSRATVAAFGKPHAEVGYMVC